MNSEDHGVGTVLSRPISDRARGGFVGFPSVRQLRGEKTDRSGFTFIAIAQMGRKTDFELQRTEDDLCVDDSYPRRSFW